MAFAYFFLFYVFFCDSDLIKFLKQPIFLFSLCQLCSYTNADEWRSIRTILIQIGIIVLDTVYITLFYLLMHGTLLSHCHWRRVSHNNNIYKAYSDKVAYDFLPALLSVSLSSTLSFSLALSVFCTNWIYLLNNKINHKSAQHVIHKRLHVYNEYVVGQTVITAKPS